MKVPVFTGSSTALITPFDRGSVDKRALGHILDIQKIAGSAAVTVCGTTGEASVMTPEEQADTIHFCAENAGDMVVIAGAGSNDTAKAVELARAAQEAGADAVLSVTPYYNKPTQSGLIDHYLRIADSIKIPLILYNVPSRTGVSLKPESCLELSRHPNINGIKEASGDLGLVSRIISLCGNDLNIWSGNDELTLPMMSLGARGVISVVGNIVPEITARLCDLCLRGRYSEAAMVHTSYLELMEAMFLVSNPIPCKTAASLMGLCREEFRLPLCPPDGETRRRLVSVLRSYGLV